MVFITKDQTKQTLCYHEQSSDCKNPTLPNPALAESLLMALGNEMSIEIFTFFTARLEEDFPGYPSNLSNTARSRSRSRWLLSFSTQNKQEALQNKLPEA